MKANVSRSIRIAGLVAMLALSVLLLGSKASEAESAAFTVNSTDDVDDGTCDPTHCSLREAIIAANAGPGTDTIEFNIPGSGPHTIQPATALPTITDPVVIDGYTQPGARPNTNGSGLGINAVLKIELDGSMAARRANGLIIVAGDSVVRGLVINRFEFDGIRLDSKGNNRIEGNFIGTDVSGTTSLGDMMRAVLILRSPNNMVGGTSEEARNLVSGAIFQGLKIYGSEATGNVVQGNLIGTDVSGTARLGGGMGVFIYHAPGTIIGGTALGTGNVISGNDDSGVTIGGSEATGNVVQGNLIGTDVTGTAPVPNDGDGVVINGAPGNVIGGTAEEARNIISGNRREGVDILNRGATGNLVQGNFIGTDISGGKALGNGRNGVSISAPLNTIGGTAPGAGNVISGNKSRGVAISWIGATGNVVQGNLIGTGTDGATPLGNGSHGVLLSRQTTDNTIGGQATGARNTIAFNARNGVQVDGYFTTGNAVRGNSIHSNGGDGVSVHYGFNTGNAILSNSIFSNAGLGIDLGGDGVSPNDAGDGDTGANNLQNFPLLATAGSGSTAIQGTLNSTPDTEFGLEFFSVNTCDPSGYGEGETLLGSAAVTTDSSGNTSFAVSFAPVGPPRRFVTATATDPDGNTSEFSPCTAIPVAECVFADGFGRGTELLVTGDAWTFTGPDGFEASGTGARQKRDRVILSGRSGNVVVSGEGVCPSGAGHFRAVELDPPRRKLRLVDLG